MVRTPIQPDRRTIPARFHPLLHGAPVFDSSCSRDARVYYLDRDGGLFLKTAAAGTLKAEAEMNAWFHSLGLGPEVLDYCSGQQDWLLTRRIPGEDCLDRRYMSDPKRLCDTLAETLRMLHSQPIAGCPMPDHTARYLRTARENCLAGCYDAALFPDNWGYASAEEARRVLEETGEYLKTDTLLHGDYCLPNIMLDNWRFSGFIDLGGAGAGDRHVDLFWGRWTLEFNLKTDAYCERFLDAYGRENIEPELFRTVAACEVFL